MALLLGEPLMRGENEAVDRKVCRRYPETCRRPRGRQPMYALDARGETAGSPPIIYLTRPHQSPGNLLGRYPHAKHNFQ